MGLQDLIITPIYLILIYLTAWLIRPIVVNKNLSKFYFSGLSIKIIGALGLGFIYQYYYESGDTYNYYYWGSRWIWEAFKDSPILAIKIIFSNPDIFDPTIYKYTSHMVFYGASGADFITRITGFFSLFTFNTYSTIAVFFALSCFIGCWWLLSALDKICPERIKMMGWIIFAIPSLIIWGSGLLKDTLMLCAVCLVFGSLIRIFYLRQNLLVNILVCLLAFFLIYKVKIYILMCLIPSVVIFIYMKSAQSIRSNLLKVLIIPLLILFTVVFTYYGVKTISDGNSQYSFDNITKTAESTAWWHNYASGSDGSAYILGDKDYSTQGIIRKILPAINVTLFRPYLWEANSLFMLLTALESLFVLMITLFVLFKKGLRSIYRALKNPIILTMLVFSLTFAFAIGAVTYNFGALARYKVCILPMYLIALVLIFFERKPLVHINTLSSESKM